MTDPAKTGTSPGTENTTATTGDQRPSMPHASDCAVHNAPALPPGPCTCGAEMIAPQDMIELADAIDRATDGMNDGQSDRLSIGGLRACSKALRFAAAEKMRPLGTSAGDCRSTLARGDEIEADFYRLKAQEWAMSPEQARQKIAAALSDNPERLREAVRSLLDDKDVTYAVRVSNVRAALHADTRNPGGKT